MKRNEETSREHNNGEVIDINRRTIDTNNNQHTINRI